MQSQPQPVRVGISLGDVTGIGPEVTFKAVAAFADQPEISFVFVGDTGTARRAGQSFYPEIQFTDYHPKRPTRFMIHDPLPQPLPEKLQPGAEPAATAAFLSLDRAARMCMRSEVDAMVTAPVSKEAIIRAGHDFVGHTEHLTQLAGSADTVMMLLGSDDQDRWLRVALATTHVAIKDLPARLTRSAVELAIIRASEACGDLGLPRKRVAVCGFNPHAGEGGKMGDEEITTITPAVESARAKGVDVLGPISADALFHHAYRGDYDAIVAMYHDQGLAPLKMVCFENGVNWTLGLPFIRTSPDHGTAYDIAGQGKASPSSMIAAIRLAVQLVRGRRRERLH